MIFFVKRRVHHTLSLFLLLFVTYLNSQNDFNSTQFRVSESDVSNTFYSKDSTANALVIYEYGRSFVHHSDYDIITNINKKIKIFNRKGFDKGTVELYLYKKNNNLYEKIYDIYATTYNKTPNGQVEITKLKKENIIKEDYNEEYDLVKFTLPNLKEGSVITYSYKIISPFIYNFHEWTFQEDIPKLYSEYNTEIPGNYIYNIKLVGWKKLDINDQKIERECLTFGTASADCAVTKYVMKDIAAFTPEKYMTTKRNYISKLEYELMTVKSFDGRVNNYTKEWRSVDSEIKLNTSLGSALRKTSHLKELLNGIDLKSKSDLEKAKAIYEYVQNNFFWDEDNHVFTKISTKSLIKERKGSVTEINVLLNNLLSLKGFKSNLVLLSTRSNGLPTKLFPVISEFNYSIVAVEIDGNHYFLDASDPVLVFGQIPFKCLNGYGRKLDFKKGSDWVSIDVPAYSRTLNYVKLKLTNDGILNGTLKTRYNGYHAITKKNNYHGNSEKYIEELENQFLNLEIEKHEVLSKGLNDAGFQEVVYLKSDTLEIKQGVFLDPFIVKFFKTNPFKLNERTYPVDFGYKDSYNYTLILDVDSNYQITEIPKNLRMKLVENKGEFSFISALKGNKLSLTFSLKFHKAQYAPYFYESLKTLMKNVVEKQTNSIVVVKKKQNYEG